MLFSRKSVQRYCFFFIYTTETGHFLHFLFKYSSFLLWNGVFLVYFCQIKSIGRSILLAKLGGFLTTESHGITRNRRYTNSPSPVGQRFKLSKHFPWAPKEVLISHAFERSLRVRFGRKLSPLSFVTSSLVARNVLFCAQHVVGNKCCYCCWYPSPAFPCLSVPIRGTYIPTDCTDLHWYSAFPCRLPRNFCRP